MVIPVESENQNEVRRISFLNRIRLHPSKLPSIVGKLYLYMFLLTYSVCVCVCVYVCVCAHVCVKHRVGRDLQVFQLPPCLQTLKSALGQQNTLANRKE